MTHASVFSGIGGPEVAASMLGWKNLFHCEINEFGRKVLDYWFPNSKSYEDITKTDFSEWRGKVNVLTGGFPCQPFSYAGKRRGSEDDRYLWPFMFRCIDQVRPDWVVAENVAGITTMVEQGEVSTVGGQASIFEEIDGLRRYRLKETFTMQRICTDLESHGYSVQPLLIPACAVGAPHRRDRVFIIGHRVTNDTNDNRTRRNTGKNEIKSGKERIQEWNEVQRINQPDKIRPESGRPTTDTSSDGILRQDYEFFADPECFGRFERSNDNGVTEKTQQKKCGQIEFSRADSTQDRWRNFPSVSPVHRGNDGIPFDVDRLAISFSKWRTESLKAYGNAIVPQVMYEIFRAIEMVERNN